MNSPRSVSPRDLLLSNQPLVILSVQFSCSVMSDSLQPPGLQHPSLPCPSPTLRAYSNSCPLSRWCHPAISSSVVPFSSHLQSFPTSGSFQWVSPEYSLEGLMLKLKLQYFGHLMQRAALLEKTLILEKIEGRRRRGRQRMRFLDGITDSMDMGLDSRSWWWTGRPGVLHVGHEVAESDTT